MTNIQKKNSFAQIFKRIKSLIRPNNIFIKKASSNMEILRDVHIPMRDGSYLSANIYIPKQKGPFPVLLSLSPGRKDVLSKDGHIFIQYRLSRIPGTITISDETSFEAPDPDFWTAKNGYVVINIDKKGFGVSPRGKEPQIYFGKEEIENLHDAIEWAGIQKWSSGNVGLFGVSYLAMNQYKVAEMNPPHLKAICPWEGISDLYKDWFYPGGVREDGFTPFFFSKLKTFGYGFDFRKEQLNREIRDGWWKSFVANFEKITIPTLNCISFSTQMFHNSGSERFYEKVASKDKWLYTHRGGEWTEYYSAEATALVLKFFDHFLKGIENGMLNHPKVRLEIREFGNKVKEVRYEKKWPPENVIWTPFYLNTEIQTLSKDSNVSKSESENEFDLKNDSLAYSYIFKRDTEIVGPMKLTLHIKLDDCDDANIFVGIQKFHNDKEVSFEGVAGFENDIVTKGTLRVALRKTINSSNAHDMPDYDFDILEPLEKNKVAKLEVKLAPSATFFAKGDELRLILQGQWFNKQGKLHQFFTYLGNVKGKCKIISSEGYSNQLLIPIIEK